MGHIHNAPDDTPTDGPKIVAVATALTVISFCFLCLRYYVRVCLLHAVGADDWFTLGTWLLTFAFTIVSSIQTSWGLGMKHIEDIPPQNVYEYQLLGYVGGPLYILSVLGFKLSLLLCYFRFVHKGMCKYGVSCVLVSCTLFHLACLIVQLAISQPVVKEFDPRIVPFYLASSSLTIVFDFAVMFLPFPVLIKTSLSTRKKVILLGPFALGFFITAIQIIRIQCVKSLTNPLDSGDLILWSTVETNLGIICACIPVLKPLVKPLFEQQQSKPSNANYYKTSWGESTAPTAARQSWKIIRERNMSVDDLYYAEEADIGRATKTDSRDSMLGKNQIRMETDIVITNHRGPEPARVHVGENEYWLNSAEGPADYNMSGRHFAQV